MNFTARIAGLLQVAQMGRFLVFAALLGLGFLTCATNVHAAYPVVAAADSGGNTTAAASTAISLPSGVETGDLLMVFFIKEGTAAITGTSSTGWTQLRGGSGSAQYSVTFWKIADGNDSLTINHASVKTAYVTYRITGHDPNTPPEDAAGLAGTSVSPNPGSLNPTNWATEQTLWVSTFGWDTKVGTGATISLSSYSSGYTDAQTTFNSGSAADDVGMAVSTRNAYVASEDPGTSTLNGSTPWIARTIAVRPLATSSATYSGTLYTDIGSTTAGAGEQITVVVPDGESVAKLSNPATLPAGQGYAPTFSPDGVYVVVPHVTTPFITIYKRSGDTFTKLTNPTSLPTGNGRSAAFSNDGVYLAIAHETSPFVTIYKRSGDTFTKLPNPSSLPAGTGYGSSFTPDGTYLAISHATSPYITIYKRDGDTFTKLTDPGDIPSGSGWDARFSPDGVHLSISLSVSPYIYIYKRDGDTFTKLADPSTLPTATSWGHNYSPDGNYLVVAQAATPGFLIYSRNGDTFTKLTDPATGLTGDGERASFSPDMQYLVVSHGTSPYFTMYRIDGTVFTKISTPSSLPTGTGRVGNFSPDGTYLPVGHPNSPFVTLYKFTRQNQTATDTTDSNGDWSVNITLSTTSPSTNVPAMAFVSSGTTTATTIFTDVATPGVRTSIPLYGGSLLIHGTTSTTSVNRYYYYDSDDNARVLYTATDKQLVVAGGLVNATNTTMEIPANYTLSVSGDVEQRGSLRAEGSTWNFNGVRQEVSGNFTDVNALGTAHFESIGLKTFTASASTTSIVIEQTAAPDYVKLSNPSGLPTGTGWGNAMSANGEYYMVAHANSPFVTLYRRQGDALTKLPTPADIPVGSALGAALSSDGTYAALAHSSTTFLNIYKRFGDTYVKLPNPANLPTGEGRGAAFSADDTYLAIAHATTPFLTIYKRTGDTFTKLANPATLPPNTGNGVAFSRDGTYLVVAHASAPRITIYKRSGDTFTKLTDPATTPTGNANRAVFSPNGNYLAVAHEASPYISVYKRSGDTFTKLTDPDSLVTANARAVDFSPDGRTIALGHLVSPFITLYTLNEDTLTRLPSPASVLPSNGQGTQFSPDGVHLLVSHQSSPFTTMYRIEYPPFMKLTNPSVVASSTSNAADFSTDSTYLAVGYSAAQWLLLYKRSGDTFTKLSDPATLPTGIVNGVSFSADTTYLAAAHNTSPYLSIYKRSGDTFTKLSDPATLPTGNGNAVDFSPDGTYLAVAHTASPYLSIYKRSGDTFTKLSDPATLPSGSASYGVTFSSDGTYLAVASDVTPFVTIYKRSGDTFTKLANPASLPPDDAWSVAFSLDTSYLVVTHSTSPFLTIYKRSGDIFTKLSNPTDLPTGIGYGASFSPDGRYLSVAHATAPFVTIYRRTGDTFEKIVNPSTNPTGIGYGASFSPDGKYFFVAHATSPRMTIYKSQALEALFTSSVSIASMLVNHGLFEAATLTVSGDGAIIGGNPVTSRAGNFQLIGDTSIETDFYAGDVEVEGALVLGRRTLYASGDITIGGSVSAETDTSQMNLNGTSPQTLAGNITSSALDVYVSGTDAKTFDGSLSIGDLVIANDSQTSAEVLFTGPSVTVNSQFINNHNRLRFDDSQIDLKRDFTNSGLLTATSSTFVFSGTAQQYATSSKTNNVRFGNLTISNTSGTGDTSQSAIFAFPPQVTGRLSMLASSSVQLPAGTTTSVGNLNLNGGSAATRAWIRSSSPGSQTLIDVNDLAEVAAYVNLRDINNSSGYNITCYFCVNVSNNSNWVFDQAGPAAVDLELGNHSAGQATNLFSTSNVTNGTLYAFSLAAVGENVSLEGFTLPVTGIRGVETGNVTNIRLWRDNNSNKSYDVGDSFIGNGVFSISGKSGTITFTSPFTQAGTEDYIITANTNSIAINDSMNLRLQSSNISGDGIVTNSLVVTTGSASRVQHVITGSGSGNGRSSQIGSNPPDTTPVGGGGQGSAGGGAGEATDGENFGDAFDYRAPNETGSLNNQWTNGSNALLSDGLRATAASTNLKQSFSGFGFAIPSGNTVRGIGVRLDASGSSAAGTLEVALSWNGGVNTTSLIATPTLTGSDAVYTLGGQTELWGRVWSPAEFSDGNFRVIVTGQPNNNTVRLDAIEVRVYSEATGGGAGGGGAI